MSDFSSSKTLAGIGSLLFSGIIGIILFIVGMKGLSEYYKDERIYDGLVPAAIFFIIGTILSVSGFILCIGIITAIIGIPLLIVGFIFELLAARYVKKALQALAERSGEHLFETAGTLILIGAILAILFVGVILIAIGFIIAAIGFLTLKEPASGAPNTYQAPPPAYGSTPPPTTQPPPTADAKANFCPNCGTPVAANATFCSHCGKQI
ncbi:MAG: DUF996 domain-containing protein [Nitrososphaerota archaeon]|jgi:uncharacterized membrane protein|nr:DUF996 domain-containing protein [Nitrososphaerota archaeon]